ncbi:MAG: HNH endonuclease signature motif containing protein [Patescibacteria group bacterium]
MEFLDITFSPKEYKRFFNKIIIDKKTNCWNWIGGKDQQGYGQGFYRSRRERVHRVIFALYKGKIPRGKNIQLDHLCRNHSCCNPDHLELVTPQINGLRGNGLQAINARKIYCKYGHPFKPQKRGGRYCPTCDNLRHKKRMQGSQRKYWLEKQRQATARYIARHK